MEPDLVEQWERVVVTVSAARPGIEPQASARAPVVPVTVMTGLLGAGKTTLLRRVLAGDHGLKIAAVVNDVADLGLDASIISGVTDEVVSLTNGCSCCTLAGDLADALRELSIPSSGSPPDAVVIELSGASDPVSVAQVVQGAPGVTLDGVVAVVDAAQGLDQVADHRLGPLMTRQLSAAHLVMVSKADLVDPPEVDALVATVGTAAPGRPVVVLRGDERDVFLLFGAALRGARPTPPLSRDHEGIPEVVTRLVALPSPLSAVDLEAWLGAAPSAVVRAKGWVRVGHADGQSVVADLQLVGPRWTLEVRPPPGDAPIGTLAVIALDDTGIDPWAAALTESG